MLCKLTTAKNRCTAVFSTYGKPTGVAARIMNTIVQMPNSEMMVLDLRNRQMRGTRNGESNRQNIAVYPPISNSGFELLSRPCIGVKTT